MLSWVRQKSLILVSVNQALFNFNHHLLVWYLIFAKSGPESVNDLIKTKQCKLFYCKAKSRFKKVIKVSSPLDIRNRPGGFKIKSLASSSFRESCNDISYICNGIPIFTSNFFDQTGIFINSKFKFYNKLLQ